MPAKVWTDVVIPAGMTQSDEIPIPHDQLVVPAGRIRGADGSKYVGADRLEFTTVPTSTGSRIVLNAPAPQDVIFKVKADTEDDETT